MASQLTTGPMTRLLTAIAAIAVALVTAATAHAANPELLWQTPEDGIAGSTGGRVDLPDAVAANSTTGSVYVTESRNARVSEFTAWGEFVRAWGWGVRDGSSEFQVCGPGQVPPTSCQAGTQGSGTGQFGSIVGGLAIDQNTGNVYVGDMASRRVQVFDEDGNFVLMFGGEVNKTTNSDVCTAASGDVCGAGVSGEGDGEFNAENFGAFDGRPIAIGPGSPATIYVGDENGRIQWFEPDGDFKGKTILTGSLAGEIVKKMAIDSSQRLYVAKPAPSFDQTGSGHWVYRYNLAGIEEPAAKLAAQSPRSIAIDEMDRVYIVTSGWFNKATNESILPEIIEYGPGGEPIIAAAEKFGSTGNSALSLGSVAVNTVTGTGQTNIYALTGSTVEVDRAYVSAYGPPPDLWPPPLRPPEIAAQYATSVGTDGAVLGADINPRFWADASSYVEYGTASCAAGGCAATTAPASLGSGAGSPVSTKGVVLTGLSPGTTYYYRFVAESTGGGPVRGIGVGEADGTFTTRKPPSAVGLNCPNSALRAGPAGLLPDCRAYEMVSPVDKNGTDIETLIQINSYEAAHNQSAEAGGKLTYSTLQGFGDAEGMPYVGQYISTRGPGGWENHGISPPQGHSPIEIAARIDVEFRAFTPDLCTGVLLHTSEPTLAAGAAEGYANLYRRQSCGEEGYDALTVEAPVMADPEVPFRDVQGITPDGRCTVFNAPGQLVPEANPTTDYQLYLSCDGVLRLVSTMPDGTASTAGRSMAGGGDAGGVRFGMMDHALSADGKQVYWTPKDGNAPLYVRVNADQGQSKVNGAEECTQAAKACTYQVSKGSGLFWAASEGGSKALYSEIGEDSILYEFDAPSKTSTQLATGFIGLVGASDDLSRAYLVSNHVLAPGGEAGKPNLYLHDQGGFTFVATLVADDVPSASEDRLSVLSVYPVKHGARVSRDGHLLFTSSAPLAGYDNTDAKTGEPAAEVYVYDPDAGELHCASCNPTGARPVGGLATVLRGSDTGTWSAAYVPPNASQVYSTRALTDDGARAYFNSFDSLVPGDTNGRQDVYQWEALGSGSCSESSPQFSPPNGGCLALISSGQSGSNSRFVDASATGEDVFFATDSSLVPQDPGLIDIYDARVDGGYPPPESPPPGCEGEACQGTVSAPDAVTPASAAFQGPGNVRESRAKPRCRKGKVRRKGRCVPRKKSGKHSSKQKGNRR